MHIHSFKCLNHCGTGFLYLLTPNCPNANCVSKPYGTRFYLYITLNGELETSCCLMSIYSNVGCLVGKVKKEPKEDGVLRLSKVWPTKPSPSECHRKAILKIYGPIYSKTWKRFLYVCMYVCMCVCVCVCVCIYQCRIFLLSAFYIIDYIHTSKLKRKAL